MRYMGSKRIIAKGILPIILKDRKNDQWYIEPFCGGCNLINKIEGKRIGNDVNKYLIDMFKALQEGWKPPEKVSEKEYNQINKNKSKYNTALVGFVGFCCSFGGKWFGGYARDGDKTGYAKKGIKRNYALESRNILLKSLPQLIGIYFYCRNYYKIPIYENSIIYCDPPYRGTCDYGQRFNYNKFYDWCRAVSKFNCKIYISEYWMPSDFKCVWEKEVNSSLDLNTGGKKEIERLYTI